jgi:hypothetical protein
MSRIVWACPACWATLIHQGAQLLGVGTGQGSCAACRAVLRPDQRAARLLVSDAAPSRRSR